MIDPVTLSILLTSIVTLLVNLHQSIAQRHFESQCCGNTVTYDSKHKNKDDDEP